MEDNLLEDHLVVRYGPGLLANRMFVTMADAVLLDGINLMPAYPLTTEDVLWCATSRTGWPPTCVGHRVQDR